MNDFQIREFRRCAIDFKYFCETYVKITNPGKGLINFRLYPFQERVVNDFMSHRFSIVRKFRQAGLTTVASIYALWKCMFDVDQRIMLLSKTDREAVQVAVNISQVISQLPDWLKPQLETDSKHEKIFTVTNSTFWFFTPEAARSRAASFLILDEAAFIKGMPTLWAGMYPVLSTGGSCAVISTVNGMRGVGEWYYETYTKAEKKQNSFHVIDLHFKEHPEYAKPEFEAMTRPNLGEKKWAQEFLGTFHGTGDTFISPTDLLRVRSMCIPPNQKEFPEWDTTPSPTQEMDELITGEVTKGAFWSWEFPEPGVDYLVSVDAGHGAGEDGDSSTIIILNLSSFEQIAEFQSNSIGAFDFSQLIASIGAMYNEAVVVVENNGPGTTVIKHLAEKLRYPNLYRSTVGKKDVPGLKVQPSNRQDILETMRTCINKDLIRIRSFRLHEELQSFVINRATMKPEASKGKHDDLVMAFALAIYASEALGRDIPIEAKDLVGVKDVVADALLGKGLDDIKEVLYRGLADTDKEWLEEFDFNGYLPDKDHLYVYGDKNKRPNDAFLRSFGF